MNLLSIKVSELMYLVFMLVVCLALTCITFTCSR